MSRVRWCFTLNNYTAADIKNIDGFYKRSIVKRLIYGLERGASGTNHLQGYLEVPTPVRITKLKLLLPKAHWEAARGTPADNYKYCSKEGKFKTFGEFRENSGNGGNENKRGIGVPDILSRLYKTPDDGIKDTGSYLCRKRVFDERIDEVREIVSRHERFSRFHLCKLRSWQMYVYNKLSTQNDRRITWVYDTDGGLGKTFFGHYLNAVKQYELFDGVTAAKDIVYLLSNTVRGIVFDVTRDDANHFSYNTLEACKNGFVMTGKYSGKRRVFKPVPVLVLANFHPDESKLTSDRWDIINLRSNGPFSLSRKATYVPQKDTFTHPAPIPAWAQENPDNSTQSPPKRKPKFAKWPSV